MPTPLFQVKAFSPLFIRVFKAGVKDTQNPHDEHCSVAVDQIDRVQVLADNGEFSIIIWVGGRQWGPVDREGFLAWYNSVTI